MAILNRFSAILLYCDSTLFCFSLQNFWRFKASNSWNRAIHDSRFCASMVVPYPLEWACSKKILFRICFNKQSGEGLHALAWYGGTFGWSC